MASDWKKLYPFESHYFDLDGLKYHYVDEGAGDPIVCVHGNPTWSFYWRNLILALRDKYRVIAVDHIGCGLSDKPIAYPYRMSKHIGNLRELLSHLKLENATLLAHDWGGPIGVGALLYLQHRFRRMILLNTATFLPESVPFKLRVARSPVFGKFAVQGMNQFLKSAFKTATVKPEIWDEAMKAGYLAPYQSWKERCGVYGFVRDIPTSPRHPTWNMLEFLEKETIKLQSMPVQMIWGMQDWVFTPAILEKMKQLFPNAEVHEIVDAGHFVMEDAKDQVISLIASFLERTSTPAADAP